MFVERWKFAVRESTAGPVKALKTQSPFEFCRMSSALNRFARAYARLWLVSLIQAAPSSTTPVPMFNGELQVLPPTRSLASKTTQLKPLLKTFSAAVRPDSPPPITITSMTSAEWSREVGIRGAGIRVVDGPATAASISINHSGRASC